MPPVESELSEIVAIHCCLVGQEVVGTTEAGELQMSKIASTTIVNHLELAPVLCPLLKAPDERNAASFIVCQTCPHSLVDSGEGYEEY